ncbi:MAG: helix-hairpin-helix domain-containing protein [Kofleriaceae bacterium]|nr:helix-hairpin-helix domain-containing protein [Kofleriaceae bacterium]
MRPAKAERIVTWRSRHGPFRRVADLRKVKGDGYKTFKKLEPYLDVKRGTAPAARPRPARARTLSQRARAPAAGGGVSCAAMALPPLHLDAQEMCQALLRIDTTNPPGNERPAVDYLAGKLREVGYDGPCSSRRRAGPTSSRERAGPARRARCC